MAETYKWRAHQFDIITMSETHRCKSSGIFIFAGKSKNNESQIPNLFSEAAIFGNRRDSISESWIPYFIGETDSFKTLSDHLLWDSAKKMGATHVHIRALDPEIMPKATRELRVVDLIKVYSPALTQPEQPMQLTPSEATMTDVQMTDELQETKSKLELLYQYEKHYLELIKEYKEEIKFANALQEDLRRERSQFFTQTLKDVVQTMKTAEVDKAVSALWIEELVASYTKSIDLSSDLAKTHVIHILGILNSEAKNEAATAKLDSITKKD